MNVGDFLDQDQRAEIIIDVIDKISQLDASYAPDNSILEFKMEGYRSTHCYGRTHPHFESVNGEPQFKITIEIDEYLYRHGLEDVLINTIAHEYCHYLQLVEMYNSVKINFDAENDQFEVHWKDLEEKEYFSGKNRDGHCGAWYKYVDVVNNGLKLRFPITDHPKTAESNLYAEINNDLTQFVVYCPKHDIPDEHFYETDFVSFAHDSREAAEAVAATIFGMTSCTKCRSNLQITFMDPKMATTFKTKAKEFLAFLALRRFMKDMFGGN